jgi:hypothetical protein
MIIQMNKFHSIGIRNITSPFKDQFHKERTWAYLNIVDEIHVFSL